MGRRILALIPEKAHVGVCRTDQQVCLEKAGVLAARIAARFVLSGLDGLTVSPHALVPSRAGAEGWPAAPGLLLLDRPVWPLLVPAERVEVERETVLASVPRLPHQEAHL